jgi:hypothetical protein
VVHPEGLIQLVVEYNVHVVESVLKYVAPALVWR